MPGAVIVPPMMQRMFKRVLDGLDLQARTGVSIGKNGNPVVKAKEHRAMAPA